jgi:Peptidase family M28
MSYCTVSRPLTTTILVFATAWAGPVHAQDDRAVEIDTAAMALDSRRLADDSLMGRLAGSEGAQAAARYIADRCAELGLAPVRGRYLHPIPIRRTAVGPQTRLTVRRGPVQSFTAPSEVVPDRGSADALRAFAGVATYVGTSQSITAGGLGDFEIHQRVAVSAGLLSPGAKDTLSRRGATGVVQLAGSPDAFDRFRDRVGPDRYHLPDSIASSFFAPLPSVVAGYQVAGALIANTPIAAGDLLTPRPLGSSLRYDPQLIEHATRTYNVACSLEGLTQRTIIVGAHYDHLGVGAPDADGDTVYNGFSDNATGVGMLLAMATALAEEALTHTVMFLFFDGEELGLLGADAYVHSPLVPLADTEAVIVLDAGAPPAPPTSWELASTPGLGQVASGVTRARGWNTRVSRARPNSDYYPFTLAGVEGMLIIPGPDPYEGLTEGETRLLRARWDHYHQPGDEWSAEYPMSGLARYAAYALSIVRRLDNSAR